MDTQLPVVSGIEATQLIKKRSSRSRVLLLTLGADDELILSMLRAGASGCLLKDADVSELLLAIRTAHRGGSYLSPRIAERMVQNYVRYAVEPDRAPAAEGAALGPRARDPAARRRGATATSRSRAS